MLIKASAGVKTRLKDEKIADLLESISIAYLQEVVTSISIPRNFWYEPHNNWFVAQWIADRLKSYGYQTCYQGKHENIFALPPAAKEKTFTLIAAHYDSVPETPGADDNASAIAALLSVARAISIYAPHLPIGFVAFNKEEDGLIGSSEFVENFLPGSNLKVSCAHVLEMVGYCNPAPGSQQLPANLPISVPDRGDFLALLSNRDSHRFAEKVLKSAKSYLPDLPVLALKIYFGIEKFIPDLSRSDHYPFWLARIPSILWTDTGEFRNPNYHLRSDSPETLDYNFLRMITQLLLATALQ